MKKTDWKDIAELIGIAAIVASLIFVGLQMQQTREIALSEAHLSRIEAFSERSNSRIQNADVWLRGNAGEELDSVDSAIYDELIRAHWSSVFWNTMSERELGFGNDIGLHDFAAFLSRNKGARIWWENWQAQIEADRNFLIEGRVRSALDIPDIVRKSLQKIDSAAKN